MNIELSEGEFTAIQSALCVAIDEGCPGHAKDWGNLSDVEFDDLLDKFQLQEKWYLYSKKRQIEHKKKEKSNEEVSE